MERGVLLGCPVVYLGLEDAGEPIVCGPVAKGSSLPSQRYLRSRLLGMEGIFVLRTDVRSGRSLCYPVLSMPCSRALQKLERFLVRRNDGGKE